ncbi:general odorant-binding protein 56d-like [Coccinella septempunctata]|uniref:general odorant-binding protein 56d-like n=1 Tax=Coccinella septempunctata TaxID=41139 RepID=UPI001D077A01|nr:general odorant-binding protein 56d-like [Coccinella septempunctata]
MKSYLILSVLCFVSASALTLTQEFESARRANHEACSKISHVNQETIKKMESGVFDDTNPDIRKHIFCYTQKVGFINDKAELQKDVIRRKMSQQVKNLDLVDKVIQMCTFPLEGDKNLWACKTLACYYKSAPGVIIL